MYIKRIDVRLFIILALATCLPSLAWGAVELQSLSFTSPPVGTSINIPLADGVVAVGAVDSLRGSSVTGGQVYYGDLTGNVTGTFMISAVPGRVISSVILESAPLNIYFSIPADGYQWIANFGLVTVKAETYLAQDDSACDLDQPLMVSSKALKVVTQGVVEDQGGAAYPSDHIFHDLLDYQGGSELVPILNSYPYIGTENQINTPRAVLYLDFNGDDFGGRTHPAFVKSTNRILDNDGRNKIEDAFQIIAESLRPFKINVTTDLDIFLATPKPLRGWVFFTNRAGGSAGLYDFGTDDPASVAGRSGNNGIESGMIGSHEVGHLLGIEHFGGPPPGGGEPLGYYLGHRSYDGANAGPAGRWSTPTAESSERLYRIRQWTKGEYTGSLYGWTPQTPGIPAHPNNYYDSLASIITQIDNLGYRDDDRANANGSAKTLIAGSEYKGIIETNIDVDVFKLTTFQAGSIVIDTFSLAAHPELKQIDGYDGRSMPALDVFAQLQDASGLPIVTADLEQSLDARIEVPNAAAGTYYLHISGTNAGNPTAPNVDPTGYTDYGSIGSYRIFANYSTDPSLAPDLVVQSFTYGVSNTTENGPWWWQITPTATIKNEGDAPAPPATARVYVRQDNGSDDALSVAFDRHDVLEPNAQTTVSMFFPRDLTLQAEGEYRLGAKADSEDFFPESSEANLVMNENDVAVVTHYVAKTPEAPSVPPGLAGEGITIESGETIMLQAMTTDPQGHSIKYFWDFDNDGAVDATSGPVGSGIPSTVNWTFDHSGNRDQKAFYVRVRAESAAENGVKQMTPWCHQERPGGLAPLKALSVRVNKLP